MHDNSKAVMAHKLEMLAKGYDADKLDDERKQAIIDYNVMMGNLEDPEEAFGEE